MNSKTSEILYTFAHCKGVVCPIGQPAAGDSHHMAGAEAGAPKPCPSRGGLCALLAEGEQFLGMFGQGQTEGINGALDLIEVKTGQR